jgi:hypothetical protein
LAKLVHKRSTTPPEDLSVQRTERSPDDSHGAGPVSAKKNKQSESSRSHEFLDMSSEEFLHHAEENAMEKASLSPVLDRVVPVPQEEGEEEEYKRNAPRYSVTKGRILDYSLRGQQPTIDRTDHERFDTYSSDGDIPFSMGSMDSTDSMRKGSEEEYQQEHMNSETSSGARKRNILSLAQLRGSTPPDTSYSSLLLAEKVEAQVKDVLSKYRGDPGIIGDES